MKIAVFLDVATSDDIEPQLNAAQAAGYEGVQLYSPGLPLTAAGGYDFPGPGQGDLNYGEFMRLLAEINYTGWGIVEHVDPSRFAAAGA